MMVMNNPTNEKITVRRSVIFFERDRLVFDECDSKQKPCFVFLFYDSTRCVPHFTELVTAILIRKPLK